MKLEVEARKTVGKVLNKKEKILVALSGGKDSTVCAYLLKKFGYEIEAIHIDLGMGNYSKKCLGAVVKLCKDLEIGLHLYDVKKEMGSSMCYLRSSIQQKKGLKNCAICGVIKKWILNKEARKLKVSKIVTGHHLDDEAQTFLLNFLKGSLQLSASTGVITRNISDKKFIPRVKPLFYVLEKDILKYSKEKKLPVVYEKCPCAIDSYRIQVREFMKSLSSKDKENIIKNFERVFPKLEKMKSQKINYCSVCGEPSMREICRVCELMR
ncbi:ATP-binding protein [Nanoarchaeota archaeon]